jgi:hypothetical protein
MFRRVRRGGIGIEELTDQSGPSVGVLALERRRQRGHGVRDAARSRDRPPRCGLTDPSQDALNPLSTVHGTSA